MTRLARTIDLEERAVDLVVADPQSTLTHIWHVAIGAGDAGTRVDTLIPHFEFGMARLDESCAAIRRVPLPDLLLVLDRDDVLYLEALCPRECQRLFGGW